MSATTTTELWRMSAMELGEAIRSGKASSREVIDAHLRRIEAVNPTINAITVLLAEQALEAATAADALVAARADLPPFHGVPFTVKENIDLVGTPTTIGLQALADAYPRLDAPVVERMRAAGAIPIGRTNCPGLAVSWHTDNELHGATLNPWDRARTPGASSGGAAAAIACGMSPLGLGSDGLGSLRWPAQCCGIAALKPTLGRIPHATTIEFAGNPIGMQLTTVQGPMARRIRDLRAALAVLAGPTWRDPWSVPAPLRGPDPGKPLRVAVVIDPAGLGTSAQVQDGVRKAASALVDAGYALEEVEPPSIELAARTLLDMLNTSEFQATYEQFTALLPADTQRFISEFYAVAGPGDPAKSMESFVVRESLLRDWGEFQEARPLIVAPICTDVPFEAGTDLEEGRVAETIRGMRMAMAVNALGLPAVAVPVGVADGLPQVVQRRATRRRRRHEQINPSAGGWADPTRQRGRVAGGGQGVLRGPGLHDPVGGATLLRRRVRDGGTAAVRRDRTRDLEGPAHRLERPGGRDRAGTPRRPAVPHPADPAGDHQLPRRRDGAASRLSGRLPRPGGAVVPAPQGAASLGGDHRSRSRGDVRDLRHRRVPDGDARPVCRAGARARGNRDTGW
jgi:amidase